MKFRNLIAAAAVAALPFAAQAATLIIPAVGTGTGLNNSQWASDVTLHTAAPRAVALTLTLHQGTNVLGPVQVTLQPRTTLRIDDIVRTRFGLTGGAGALLIDVNDRDARTLAVTSRTFNTTPEGVYGQDIPAVDISSAGGVGDVIAIPAAPDAATSRFNFGTYAVEAANVQFQLVRADGSVAATKDFSFAAGQHAQFNSSILGVAAEDNDTLHARLLSGRALFYGSVINSTGDPGYVPGIRAREDIVINFAGVDLDENGTVDIVDANGDGVLDAPIQIVKSLYPDYFRIVAGGEFGESVQFEVVSAPGVDADLLDNSGRLRVAAGANVALGLGEIRVRATANDGSSTVLVIPVNYR